MPTKVQLFATCLSEQFYPGVLEKTVTLLERLGVEVSFPPGQTCCGQPHFNSGFHQEAKSIARQWLRAFSLEADEDTAIVAPSGSCVDMVRHHYRELFPEGSEEYAMALALGERTFELTEFLVEQMGVVNVGAYFPGKVTYHASCHQLRGLGVREAPKKLLQNVRGLELVPLEGEEVCCGFGGAFSVIYPEVSRAMLAEKVRNIEDNGAEAVASCDAGCLMNIGGGLRRAGSKVRAMHIVEILASTGEAG